MSPPSIRPTPESPRLKSVVFRLPKSKHEAVKQLSKRTRIRKSEYMREAIADLLKKHGVE